MRSSLIIVAFGAMAFAAPTKIPEILPALLGAPAAPKPAGHPKPEWGAPAPAPAAPAPEAGAGDEFQFEQPPPPAGAPPAAKPPKPDMLGMLLGPLGGMLGKLKAGMPVAPVKFIQKNKKADKAEKNIKKMEEKAGKAEKKIKAKEEKAEKMSKIKEEVGKMMGEIEAKKKFSEEKKPKKKTVVLEKSKSVVVI